MRDVDVAAADLRIAGRGQERADDEEGRHGGDEEPLGIGTAGGVFSGRESIESDQGVAPVHWMVTM